MVQLHFSKNSNLEEERNSIKANKQFKTQIETL
jgi:hypothetical protein